MSATSVPAATDAPAGSIWSCQPEAEAFVLEALDRARRDSPLLGGLAADLEAATATKLVDWVDSIGVRADDATLVDLGWRRVGATGLWRHPAAQLPALTITPSRHVALRADDVEACAGALDAPDAPTGAVDGAMRVVRIGTSGAVEVLAVERRSFLAGPVAGVATTTGDGAGVTGVSATADDAGAATAARALWADRPLDGDAGAAMAEAIERARALVEAVGTDRAAAFVLEHERSRWQARCGAGRGTHAVQQRFGLGFANRDHHTLRSSRLTFGPLIACLHTLGFESREQFHAGADAGWGALVLEHPGTGDVVFADVDLDPDEAGADLAAGLGPRPLGPVGAWCATHGDSFLQAGLHHLAALYDFDHYRLAPAAPPMQDPFSELEHLRQAFTIPETWTVDPARAATLLADPDLPPATAERLRAGAAPGSHLEIIERRHGFKGFNQRAVSRTIAANDLRT